MTISGELCTRSTTTDLWKELDINLLVRGTKNEIVYVFLNTDIQIIQIFSLCRFAFVRTN